MEQLNFVLPFPSIFYAPVYVAQTREHFLQNAAFRNRAVIP